MEGLTQKDEASDKEATQSENCDDGLDDETSNSNIVPGSGVWEKSENKRWIVVVDSSLHRIPGRNRTRSEGSLDPSLSIHSFVSNFEVEELQPSNYRVISDGSSLVRVDREEGTPGNEEEDPMEGSSGTQQTRRVNVRARRRSSHLSSPEHLPPPVVETVSSSGGRRRRRRRRKKKVFLVSGNSSGRKKWKREIILSVESSPGRDSPSPDTLRQIVERKLSCQGEGIRTVLDDEREEAYNEIFSKELEGMLDKLKEGGEETEDVLED